MVQGESLSMDKHGRIRVLFVLGSLGCGGAERVALDIASKIDHERFSIDFLIQTGADEFYHDEVIASGASIFHSPRFNPASIADYRKWLKKFVLNSDYDIVHFHQNTMVTSVSGILHENNIKIISHAHNSSFRGSFLAKICKRLLIIGLRKRSDFCVGCSDKAAAFFYGNDWRTKPNCTVIPNAVDTDRFEYNLKSRLSIRSKFGLNEETIVIGHVGSFSEPKNHLFLVEVFSRFLEKCDNAKLLLVGDGILKDEIKAKAKSLCCLDKIIFAGNVKCPEEYYSAMDVFAFPSIFEGLPLSVVEAQVSGLNCVISSAITKDVVISNDQVILLPINDSSQWADKLYDLSGRPRKNINKKTLLDSKWSMTGFVTQFEKIYSTLANR